MKCPVSTCQANNKDGAEFCSQCGTELKLPTSSGAKYALIGLFVIIAVVCLVLTVCKVLDYSKEQNTRKTMQVVAGGLFHQYKNEPNGTYPIATVSLDAWGRPMNRDSRTVCH